jgi:outer membrane biosynthesis protein TonB
LLTSKTLSADIPVVSGPTIDGFLVRSYATTTKKKPATKTKPATKKKTTTKKKAPAKKKAAAKKPKKVAKKKPVKKKVAKKPAKPTRPTVLAAPSARGLSGYVVYIQNHLKSTSGPGGPERLSEAVTQWRSLPDAEKQVLHAPPFSRN